jgi:5'-nucleotidase
MHTRRYASALILLPTLACAGPPAGSQPVPADFPQRVLITNDDGIGSPRIVALARAFSEVAEVWVVAPAGNRSGAGAGLSFNRTRELSVQQRSLGSGIHAFAVDGTPADCVLLGLFGIMRDNPPDLVVSGINAGPNLGADWLFSGTIGAARVAAAAGFPALAVSGPYYDAPGAADSSAHWVVRLARGELLRQLAPPGYLSVALPPVPPARIKGVVALDRAPLRLVPRFEADGVIWRVIDDDPIGPPNPADSDEAGWMAGYIVLTPMRADEVDADRLRSWTGRDLTDRLGAEREEGWSMSHAGSGGFPY